MQVLIRSSKKKGKSTPIAPRTQPQSHPPPPPTVPLTQDVANPITTLLDILANTTDDHLYTMDTDPVVFGTPADLMVLKEDIEQFLASEEIGATTIMIYMRYVY